VRAVSLQLQAADIACRQCLPRSLNCITNLHHVKNGLCTAYNNGNWKVNESVVCVRCFAWRTHNFKCIVNSPNHAIEQPTRCPAGLLAVIVVQPSFHVELLRERCSRSSALALWLRVLAPGARLPSGSVPAPARSP
jgi:hypothetical protein